MRTDLVFRGTAAELRQALRTCRAHVVSPTDAVFPAALDQLKDKVPALFVRGRLPSDPGPAVAVVGSRTASRAGLDLARSLGRGLARAGVTVVSGAARGVDTASHEGALDVGGRTIAVLGCGIDVDYPRSNRDLFGRIVANGAVVSEYPPGVPPEPYRFPVRNRIIAGLAQAVVIVEGAASSGSLITCRHALDLGREVFAVPGPVTSPLSEAAHGLIRDGAHLIRGADDLLHDLNLHTESVSHPLPLLALAEEQVYATLRGPTLAEEIAASLEWPIADVVAILMQLELKGVVRCVGGRYERRLRA